MLPQVIFPMQLSYVGYPVGSVLSSMSLSMSVGILSCVCCLSMFLVVILCLVQMHYIVGVCLSFFEYYNHARSNKH